MNFLSETALTMTSREIAELVGSRHDKVKQSIERLVERGIIRNPPMGVSEEINNLGLPRKIHHYVFAGEEGKRDSIVVVAQLSPEFTARLVDRWRELENRLSAAAAEIPPKVVFITDPDVARLVGMRDGGLLSPEEASLVARRMVGLEPVERETEQSADSGQETYSHIDREIYVSLQSAAELAGISPVAAEKKVLRLGLAKMVSGALPGGRRRMMLTDAGRRVAVQNGTAPARWHREKATRALAGRKPR